MLQIPTSPVPCISISLAPYEITPVEPKSPFVITLPEESGPESPSPQHLLPPPVLSPLQLRHVERRSQLSPLSSGSSGKGLERAKFEAMLKASKERSAMVGSKKPVELRKELAVKVQMAKQLQRRARFLNKLAEPPSPSATDMPVTPPESPAIFHFCLPSPGLESPLDVFENLSPTVNGLAPRIEQVDFRLPSQKLAEAARQKRMATQKERPARQLPSLDQISRRLVGSPTTVVIARSPSPDEKLNRLPSFLRNRPAPSEAVTSEKVPAVRPRLTLALRDASRFTEEREPTPIVPKALPFPPSPKSPCPPKLQVITTVCPPTRSKTSPTEFTEANITQFTSTNTVDAVAKQAVVHREALSRPTEQARRAAVTKDMFNKLSRRTPCLAGAAACGIKAKDDIIIAPPTDDRLKRRTSAPAELPVSQRKARHPVLDKPGGF